MIFYHDLLVKCGGIVPGNGRGVKIKIVEGRKSKVGSQLKVGELESWNVDDRRRTMDDGGEGAGDEGMPPHNYPYNRHPTTIPTTVIPSEVEGSRRETTGCTDPTTTDQHRRTGGLVLA
jgi:hypothetical protein